MKTRLQNQNQNFAILKIALNRATPSAYARSRHPLLKSVFRSKKGPLGVELWSFYYRKKQSKCHILLWRNLGLHPLQTFYVTGHPVINFRDILRAVAGTPLCPAKDIFIRRPLWSHQAARLFRVPPFCSPILGFTWCRGSTPPGNPHSRKVKVPTSTRKCDSVAVSESKEQ